MNVQATQQSLGGKLIITCFKCITMKPTSWSKILTTRLDFLRWLSASCLWDLIGAMGQVIGNSFSVHAVVMLCHSLLCFLGRDAPRNHHDLVQCVGVAAPGWLLLPKFEPHASDSPETARLVAHFARVAERGGTDVRLDVGVPFRAKAWPRAGINSSLFHWSIVHGYSWKSTAHINVLELQATLNAVKWRLRKAQNGKLRCLHLIDNQSVCAVIAKGRCSAYRLKPGLKKLNSLVLASGIVLAVGYVATDSNPSDIPSRWSARSLLLKNKSGRKRGKVRRSIVK